MYPTQSQNTSQDGTNGKRIITHTEQRRIPNVAPTDCATRDRAQDVAAGAAEIALMLERMDSDVARRMVQAREAALNIHKAFPGGDQRFQDVEDDDDDDDENDDENEEQQEEEEEEEEEEETETEGCVGLLDDSMDSGPHACLKRVRAEHDGFDLVSEMNGAQLDILQRIRVVNWIRTLVRVHNICSVDVIARVRNLLSKQAASEDAEVLQNDAYLAPVIEGDLLLTALESDDHCDDSVDVQSADWSTENGNAKSKSQQNSENDSNDADTELVRQAVMRTLENSVI